MIRRMAMSLAPAHEGRGRLLSCLHRLTGLRPSVKLRRRRIYLCEMRTHQWRVDELVATSPRHVPPL